MKKKYEFPNISFLSISKDAILSQQIDGYLMEGDGSGQYVSDFFDI